MAFNSYVFNFNKIINNSQLRSEINAAVAKTMFINIKYVPTELPLDYPRVITIQTEDPIVLTAGEQSTITTTITNHVPTTTNEQDKEQGRLDWEQAIADLQQTVTDFQADFNDTPTTITELADNQILIKDLLLELTNVSMGIA
jgi:hypothetical protein